MERSEVNRPSHIRTVFGDSLLELAAYTFLSVFLFVVSWIALGWEAVSNYCFNALVVCFVSGVMPTLGLMRRRTLAHSESSILLIMGARVLLVLGALAVSAATKWPHHNSFCNCLLGYYFLFLLLQSALLIRNQSFPPPPQS